MTEQVVKKEGPRGQGHCPTEDPVIAKGDAVELLKNSEMKLKLKLQYLGHLMRRTDLLEKTLMEEKGTTDDEMVEWHHQLNGHKFEQALRDGEGQGSLACCSSWDCPVGHN